MAALSGFFVSNIVPHDAEVYLRSCIARNVRAALAAGSQAVNGHGKLIASQVIARLHDGLLKLLPG